MLSLETIRQAIGGKRPRQLPIEGAMRRAAVAAVLREQATGVELLFIRRAEHPKDPWSGHMAFPGGRVDETDTGPLAAAMRETLEELDLDLGSSATLIGELAHLPAMAKGKPLPMVIVPYVFELHGAPELKPDASEVQEALWVPVRFLADPGERHTIRHAVAGVSVSLPACTFEGRTIWGLTLRMVDDLLSAIEL